MKFRIALVSLLGLFICLQFSGFGLLATHFATDPAINPTIDLAMAVDPLKNEHSPQVVPSEVEQGTVKPNSSPNSSPNSAVVPGNISVNISDQGLSPDILNVTPGTTVIWINKTHSKAKVTFLRHAVSTTCRDPRGFLLSDKGIYTSNLIVGGEVASLCFLERQAYDYEVVVLSDDESLVDGQELSQAKQILKGTITVQ